MAVFRIAKTENYTVMSNFHFKEHSMSLKAKGLLSLMLSLPENWDYSIAGLSTLSSDGESSVRSALKELEAFGYLTRETKRDSTGRITDWVYNVYEKPVVENQHVDNQVVDSVDNKILTDKILKNKKLKNIKKSENTSDFLCSAKKKQPGKNRYQQCLDLINSYTDQVKLKQLLQTFLKQRLESDKPLYVNQWKGLLNKLKELSNDDLIMQINIVQQSIDRGYLSFYPVKNFSTSDNKFDSAVSDRLSPEERDTFNEWVEDLKNSGLRAEF